VPASRQYFQPAEKKEKPASGRLSIEGREVLQSLLGQALVVQPHSVVAFLCKAISMPPLPCG
jgi:hypothetical protein